MKDQKAIKLKTNRFVLKNLIVIVVLAFAALAGVWSWMTNKTTAEASGISLACEVPDGIEYQIVEHGAQPEDDKWIKGSMVLSSEKYEFLNQLSFREVTGDGTLGSGNSVNLYRPTLKQSGSVVTVDEKQPMASATANQDFLTFDLWVRSKSVVNLYLDKTTTIYPNSTDFTENLNTDGYSKDAVVGAVRCAVNESDDDFLWIPAPNVYYDEASNFLYTNITDRTHRSYKHIYDEWLNNKVVQTTIEGNGVVANSDYTIGSVRDFITLTTPQQGSTDYNTGMANFTIWFEGEDAEARGAFVGGQIKIKLVLTTEKN